MAVIVELWLMFGAGFVTGWFLRDAKSSRREMRLYRDISKRVDAAIEKVRASK